MFECMISERVGLGSRVRSSNEMLETLNRVCGVLERIVATRNENVTTSRLALLSLFDVRK